MKKIPLTQGRFALVDDTDFERLKHFKWHAVKYRNAFYAYRGVQIDNKAYSLPMHRVILGLVKGDGKHSDHIDGDGLNNQRFNLRVCTNQQNHFNIGPSKGSLSKYKGVSWRKREKKWYVQITVSRKQIYLGVFTDEIEAAKAYDKKAKEVHGEFARLNFKVGGDLNPRYLPPVNTNREVKMAKTFTKDNQARIRRIKAVERIRKVYWAAKQRGVTMGDLAHDIGTSIGTLSSSLSGKHTTLKTVELYEVYFKNFDGVGRRKR